MTKCKDCPLWNKKEGVCGVVVLHEGLKYEVKTQANDPCIWVELGMEEEVKKISMWSNGKDGFIETAEETSREDLF